MSRHAVDGYEFDIVQESRWGPMKWYCGEIRLPPAPNDPATPFVVPRLAMRRDGGWWAATYRGCRRRVEKAIRRHQVRQGRR